MDRHIRALCREYAAEPSDYLAHSIVRSLLRSEEGEEIDVIHLTQDYIARKVIAAVKKIRPVDDNEREYIEFRIRNFGFIRSRIEDDIKNYISELREYDDYADDWRDRFGVD